jgi:hypothetical protein
MIQRPDPLAAEAAARLLDAVTAALHGLGLDETQTVHAARYLRSAVHGFVSLESAGGFGLPVDLDQGFELLAATTTTGLRAALAENAGG